jgi:hypothetical protein
MIGSAIFFYKYEKRIMTEVSLVKKIAFISKLEKQVQIEYIDNQFERIWRINFI